MVVPTDQATGDWVIGLVNNKEIVIQNHTLKAGWNLSLPEVAMVSVRYKSVSKRDPVKLIEDPRNGIARMNRWKIEGKELAYFNHSPDPKNTEATFVRVLISRNVCQLIQNQRGSILISGGTATVQWPASNGKLLDSSNEPQFEFQ